MTNEKSSLLPSHKRTFSGYDAGDEDDDDNNSGTDKNFPPMIRTNSLAKMKRVVHNDPTLSRQYESAEDFQKLLGSTALLKNKLETEETKQESRSQRTRAASFSMTLQTAPEHEMYDTTETPDGQAIVGTRAAFYKNDQSSSQKMLSGMSSLINKQIRKPTKIYLKKIKNGFFDDAKSLAEGTIPQSIVLAIVIGIVCGIACYLYYTVLFWGLEFLWETLPRDYVEPNWSPEYYWLWIPLVSFSMVTLVGLTVVFMGEPGDLPYTISRVHCEAYIPMDHVNPMVFASMFSILAGGSLGPEAPLVAICGALGGFVSRRIFRQSSTNVVRKHTFMGMAGALAAFFGVPLGGSLFALEVCSRFGVEYFEHLIESIFCGEICLMVFRGMKGLPIEPIWNLTSTLNPRMADCEPMHIVLGALIGLYGALVAYFFALFHWKNMEFFGKLNLLNNSRAVYRGWLGAIFIVILSLLVPHTAFWGEEEIQVVANMLPAKELPNIWPTEGLIGFEIDGPFSIFIMGCCKLIAVSFTVAGGLRGGFIFPLMCAGSAFGRLLYYIIPESVPVQVVVLSTAAALNVAITRTSLATTLILAFLPGEPMAIPPILMASICSLFATSYMPFIKSQITRSDLDHSLFHEEHHIDVDSVFSDTDADTDDENY
jgi:H+/Cl- antiporter ClcA